MNVPIQWLLTFAITVQLASVCMAQDMRVYTTVSKVSASEGQPQVIARTLTLFHAGKVYDHIEEVGEVVIFEPIHNRFRILNGNYVATTVPFDQLQQLLRVARSEAVRYLDDLDESADPREQRIVPALKFQLNPLLRQEYADETGRLQMIGDYLSYDVQTAAIEQATLLDQYLAYADWACRLNYVLHPQSMYPESRLQLNDALRNRRRLPTTVSLTARVDAEIQLRAEHRFGWELHAFDKDQINKWERLLQSDRIRWVSFHEYQQQVMTASSK
ncbi:hypothetical protein Mal4_13810 [Maioricimonas rarisocia]|uniref:Uncharacterized protein n=1 Tax=Maioricimonas rarisocia TaxID=2528026 RepID=A0A517Z3N8_9PLAN|nr:hypothetical protein [Maioricimonas rarisocia]QDU37078.1 hypothetical protein Mal4_13810 [Maioricimonas rarisocia]